MTVRQLVYESCRSTYSEWHRENMPSDRTHTDIDGVDFSFYGPRIVEQRSIGYVPPNPDRALKTLRAFARKIGWAFAVTKRLPVLTANTQHVIFVTHKDDVFFVTAVRGNISLLRRRGGERDEDFPLIAFNKLRDACLRVGIPAKMINVDTSGKPISRDDIRWLRMGQC